jgi:hypothetical protein
MIKVLRRNSVPRIVTGWIYCSKMLNANRVIGFYCVVLTLGTLACLLIGIWETSAAVATKLSFLSASHLVIGIAWVSTEFGSSIGLSCRPDSGDSLFSGVFASSFASMLSGDEREGVGE